MMRMAPISLAVMGAIGIATSLMLLAIAGFPIGYTLMFILMLLLLWANIREAKRKHALLLALTLTIYIASLIVNFLYSPRLFMPREGLFSTSFLLYAVHLAPH